MAAAGLITTFGGDATGAELEASVGTAEMTRLIGTGGGGGIRTGDDGVTDVGTGAEGVSAVTTGSEGVSEVSTGDAGVSEVPTDQGCTTPDQGWMIPGG